MAFPTVSLLDNFKRAEELELSNGGKWAKLGSFSHACKVEAERGTFAGFEAAEANWTGSYWTVKEFSEPGVAAQFKSFESTGHYKGLYCCLSSGTEAKPNGYRLRVIGEGKEKMVYKLEKLVTGTPSVLGEIATTLEENDFIGLSVQAGKVIGWRKHAGVWSVILEAADSAYTKGLIGLFGSGTPGTSNVNSVLAFEAGESRKESETFAAKLEGKGALPRNTTHAFTTPSLSPKGTTKFAFAKAFIASLSIIGSTTKAFVIAKALVASQTFQGTIKRAFSLTKSLSAKLTFTGKLAKGLSIRKAFTAALSFTGNVATKAGIFGQTLTASIGFKGTTKKAFSFARKLVASLSPSGAFTAGRELIVQRLTAGLSFVGSLVGKKPIQTWTMPGSVARAARAIGSIRRTNQPQPPRKSEDV